MTCNLIKTIYSESPTTSQTSIDISFKVMSANQIVAGKIVTAFITVT
jgi:hypothetical protein